MVDNKTEEEKPHCAECGKTESVNDSGKDTVPLQVCGRCLSIRYCSRECQKQHWKTHKKECAKKSDTNKNATSGVFSHISIDPSASGFVPQFNSVPLGHGPNTDWTNVEESAIKLDRTLAMFSGNFSANPPKMMHKAVYLNSLKRQKALKVIIDSYRLRVEDEYVFQGKNRALYGGEDPLPDFMDYLKKAEKRGGILPQWWDAKARDECQNLALKSDGGCFIRHAVEKHGVIKEYGDRLAPMRLRMIAQLVEGSQVA